MYFGEVIAMQNLTRTHRSHAGKSMKGRPTASMTSKQLERFPFLPLSFESQEFTIKLRNKVAKATTSKDGTLLLAVCETRKYCGSGLCPRCVRRFRGRLLKFIHKNDLHEQVWSLATVRPQSWEVPAGDDRPFTEIIGHQGKLNDIPALKTLVQALRRSWNQKCNRDPEFDKLIMIGSIETNFDVVGGTPDKKPFHLHLAVLGLKPVVVKSVLKASVHRLGLDQTNNPNFRVVDVKSDHRSDQRPVTSYAFKQPYWRLSKKDKDHRGWKYTPSANELLELAYNYGSHQCQDRLLTVGIEYRGNQFRFSRVKSKFSSANEKVAKNIAAAPLRRRKTIKKRKPRKRLHNTGAPP